MKTNTLYDSTNTYSSLLATLISAGIGVSLLFSPISKLPDTTFHTQDQKAHILEEAEKPTTDYIEATGLDRLV
ncbi:MAG: hypothetical protein MAG795_00467 [Candidatus Woesearchaeota archaeon]|nr:hypothetical protein [Candidatus Woesearchaeota archaeon]